MVDQTVLARQWRESHPEIVGGYVVVFVNEVAGWVAELRRPAAFVPGCVAIHESGSVWVAVDGNEYDGAERWEAC